MNTNIIDLTWLKRNTSEIKQVKSLRMPRWHMGELKYSSTHFWSREYRRVSNQLRIPVNLPHRNNLRYPVNTRPDGPRASPVTSERSKNSGPYWQSNPIITQEDITSRNVTFWFCSNWFIRNLRLWSNTHPSISDSSWLMVWLAYGCNTELVLFAPTESISSMKITHGARSFAASAEQNDTWHVTSASSACANFNLGHFMERHICCFILQYFMFCWPCISV